MVIMRLLGSLADLNLFLIPFGKYLFSIFEV